MRNNASAGPLLNFPDALTAAASLARYKSRIHIDHPYSIIKSLTLSSFLFTVKLAGIVKYTMLTLSSEKLYLIDGSVLSPQIFNPQYLIRPQ